MREDTADWLAPMIDAAGERGLDDAEPATAIAWIEYGYLLRSRLGWDESYPPHPRIRLG
jgi:hypothetical protein